jgi:hypothetical protein
MLQIIIQNLMNQYCTECGSETKTSKGYTPSVKQILGSASLSPRQKAIMLDLYHDKNLVRVESEYYVEDNQSREEKKMIREIGDALANLTRRNPKVAQRVIERVMDQL